LFERLYARWVPQLHRARVRSVMAHLQRQLTRWVWARLTVAVYFGVVSGVGLALFGVPFALTISLVGAVLEIVPYLGGLAIVLAAFSALTVRPILILWVVLFYVVAIEVKGHFIEPALYGRAMGLHPGIVLIALVVGLKAGGVIGRPASGLCRKATHPNRSKTEEAVLNEERVRQIVELEKRAKEVRDKAARQAEQLPAQAEKEAKALLEQARADAQAQADQLIAKAQAEEESERIEQQAKQEAERMKAQAMGRFDRAVSFVLNRLTEREDHA
jgi:vacuolar-type H+-ATPase subunit H